MNQSPAFLRRQEWFKPLCDAIKNEGADVFFEKPQGRGHFKAVIRYKGQERKMPVPGSPSGAMRINNLLNMARQKIEDMR